MMTDVRDRTRAPELEEQEVDLGRYASAVAARWWLPLLGLLAGALLGYVMTLGGTQVYRAQALVYLGQPYTANGGSPISSLATTPTFLRQAVTSEAAVRRAARAAGLPPAKVRGRITAAPVTAQGPAARSAQGQLWTITVTGEAPAKTADAANAVAASAIDQVDEYVEEKIARLERELRGYETDIASLDRRIGSAVAVANDRSLPPLERLVASNMAGVYESRRANVVDKQLAAQGLIAQAETIERPRVVDRAAARRTTAQSRRNSIVVAATLGLLLGLAAALLWDVAQTRRGRDVRR